MNASIDLEENFIKMPSVAGARRLVAQVVGIRLTKLETPFSDSLIAEGDALQTVFGIVAFALSVAPAEIEMALA
jgi:hypothetical protein